MKKLFTIFILSLFAVLNSLDAQTSWLWAKSAGNNGYDYSHSVATDQAGNSYMTGEFNTNINFGNGFTFASNGASDLFIVKYDVSGNPTWAWAAGGNGADISNAIATDKTGNLYIAGYFKSPTMVLGSFTLTNAGGNTFDLFIAKFDPNGNVLWAKSAAGTGDDRAYGIAVDTLGNVLVTGYFVSTTITFDAQVLNNTGALDLFLVKYNPAGTAVWARSAAGSSSGTEYSYSVACDKAGNAFIGGSFNSSTLTFGAIVLTHRANNDIFVAKYSAAGLPLWAQQAGQNSDNAAYSVAVDDAGNCYAAGSFKSSTLVFGDVSYDNHGHMDAFIFKYRYDGLPIWAKTAGGTEEDAGRAVCVDAAGNCHFTGYFKSSSIDFGGYILNNVSTSTADIFISEYDPNAYELLVKGAGGSADDIPYSIALDTARNFFISGYFSSPTLVFGNTTLTQGGTTDPFIVKSSNILVGVDDRQDDTRLTVYPNPATDQINVELKSASTVSIYNLNGQLCLTRASGPGTVTMDVSNLTSGLYFVRIDDGRKVSSSKVVIK